MGASVHLCGFCVHVWSFPAEAREPLMTLSVQRALSAERAKRKP